MKNNRPHNHIEPNSASSSDIGNIIDILLILINYNLPVFRREAE
jgi:hypothetical protein